VFDRCQEVQENPDGYIDLWAREHYKSTIITYAQNIQDILKDPETTIGIFSHTSPIAKAFLAQIKRELEQNEMLQGLFPDVLYTNPQKESPCWSLDKGIIVKRKGNPKECTVEASGLVDGQPTSKHYKILVYDDVVTRESVATPEQIQKTTEAWALSLNLGSKEDCKIRYIGTRYHGNDTYKTILDRKAAIPRIYPATDDGTINGKPVFISQESLDKKLNDMGSYIFAAQMLLDPLADSVMGFKEDWLSFYNAIDHIKKWNFYIVVDPASEKKKLNDYSVLAVIGLAPDHNYYLVDGIRDRLNLTERTKRLFDLVKKWNPLNVGYEKYGMQCDIEHIQYVQEQENYRFRITALGGNTPKNDRIRRLVPIFENHKFYLPRRLLFISHEGKAVDFIHDFINSEFTTFPVCSHDDMLDSIARILDTDLGAVFPKEEMSIIETHGIKRQEVYDPLKLNHTQARPATYSPLNREPTSKTWQELHTVK
jgi:predicted phage terminase large subunit-like protein